MLSIGVDVNIVIVFSVNGPLIYGIVSAKLLKKNKKKQSLTADSSFFFIVKLGENAHRDNIYTT